MIQHEHNLILNTDTHKQKKGKNYGDNICLTFCYTNIKNEHNQKDGGHSIGYLLRNKNTQWAGDLLTLKKLCLMSCVN